MEEETGTAPGLISRQPPEKLRKCVIVIDQALPLGQIANTAAVLALSLGKRFPEMIGADLVDSEGHVRLGITTHPIPVLKSTVDDLRALREKCKPFEPELTVIELISATGTTRSYADYADALRQIPADELTYRGLVLCGETRCVNRFTGSLGLLR